MKVGWRREYAFPRAVSGRTDEESGFVLITALWLLLLCGAIVALMMVRSAGKSQAIRASALQVQARLDQEAAVETVAADLLFRGGQSQWARAPTQGTIEIDGRALSVNVSSEAGRLDVNDGDLAVIDRALQGLGIAPDRRASFAGALQALRAQNRRIGSQAELDHLLADLGPTKEACLDNYTTLYAGLTRPAEQAMPAALARALAVPQAGGGRAETMLPGTAIRLRIGTADGALLVAVIRVVGTLDRSYDVMRWTRNPPC